MFHGLVGAAVGAAFILRAQAQAWPTRPIRLIVPFAPGGNSDMTARACAPIMSTKLGPPVVVENRNGAGGSVAAQQVARLRPDGYTILLGPNGPLTINPTVQNKLGYDPIGDYAPIGLFVRSPMVIAVHRSTPTTTEAGVAGFQAAVFVGIVAPTGLPDDVAKALGEAASAAVADAGVRRQMEGWEA